MGADAARLRPLTSRPCRLGPRSLRPSPGSRRGRSQWWWLSSAFRPRWRACFGPYLEEQIHLSALQRMLSGDVPYRTSNSSMARSCSICPNAWCNSLTDTLCGFTFMSQRLRSRFSCCCSGLFKNASTGSGHAWVLWRCWVRYTSTLFRPESERPAQDCGRRHPVQRRG